MNGERSNPMPIIDFNFSGYVRGAVITRANSAVGEEVDVRGMSAPELIRKLEAGDLFISLGDYLYSGDNAEIEMTDYEMASGRYPDEL